MDTLELKVNSFEEYQTEYQKSIDDNQDFWSQKAQCFEWNKKWESVLTGSLKDANVKWFDGGELNITVNCLDRHLEKRGDKVAVLFEPNDPTESTITYTYKELHQAVCKAANMLEGLGVQKGDRVCLYMSMVPELLISVLACARIGAIHSVVFGGFSATSLADRINDSQCKWVICSDGGLRGNKVIPLKEITDEALKKTSSVKSVIVHQKANNKIQMQEGRDYYWKDLFQNASEKHEAASMKSEDPLFILYTSGSTGKPKGVIHTTAGYMVWAAYTFQNVFQIEEDSIYWCTADIGWITGHSYITYGPLLSGSTTMMFEGVPTYPDIGRFWQICEKHKVSHFYTAPTAIRSLMGGGTDVPDKYDLSSLKVLGTVGEPINEEAWNWYHKHVGKEKCPIVDTWWQTETGGIMISPLAGLTKTKPCFATLPLPGVKPVLVDADGKEIEGNDVSGNLCIDQPWPGMARTVYGDHERYIQTYLSTYPGRYFTGDGCRRDEEGFYRITGRVDDVINMSGHRIGTAEVEDAINQHPNVIESAVVGYPHEIKGEALYAYVICAAGMGGGIL